MWMWKNSKGQERWFVGGFHGVEMLLVNILFVIIEPDDRRQWVSERWTFEKNINTSRTSQCSNVRDDLRWIWNDRWCFLKCSSHHIPYSRYRPEILWRHVSISHCPPHIRWSLDHAVCNYRDGSHRLDHDNLVRHSLDERSERNNRRKKRHCVLRWICFSFFVR